MNPTFLCMSSRGIPSSYFLTFSHARIKLNSSVPVTPCHILRISMGSFSQAHSSITQQSVYWSYSVARKPRNHVVLTVAPATDGAFSRLLKVCRTISFPRLQVDCRNTSNVHSNVHSLRQAMTWPSEIFDAPWSSENLRSHGHQDTRSVEQVRRTMETSFDFCFFSWRFIIAVLRKFWQKHIRKNLFRQQSKESKTSWFSPKQFSPVSAFYQSSKTVWWLESLYLAEQHGSERIWKDTATLPRISPVRFWISGVTPTSANEENGIKA